jgi:DNA-binding response OmpR family regulator
MAKNPKPVVLVADDEPSTRALVAGHLRAKGYKIIEAGDGDEAWELAHEHLPHAVVLDVMMPGMSGWEVCRKIREAVSLAHTGVVMLTGIGENLNELTSPLYGADAYVDKPFEFGELDKKLAETLARRGGGAVGRLDGADQQPAATGGRQRNRAERAPATDERSKPAKSAKRAAGVKQAQSVSSRPAPTKKPAKSSKRAAKPTTSSKRTARAKPATSSKPAARAKPATSSKPATCARPTRRVAKPAKRASAPAKRAKNAARPAAARAKSGARAKPAKRGKPGARTTKRKS